MRFVSYSVKVLWTCLLVSALALPLWAAAGEDGRSKGPVKAKEPSSVTVYGRQAHVDAQALEREPPRKTGGFKRALSKTWNGVVDLGGWLLNAGEDIPAEREQRSRKEERK